MTMKKKAGRASRADISNVIGLAVAQAKGRVQQLDADGIDSVSGGDWGGVASGSGSGGGIGPVIDIDTTTTAGMVDTDPDFGEVLKLDF